MFRLQLFFIAISYCGLVSCAQQSTEEGNTGFKLVQNESGFVLEQAGKPIFIKGAVASGKLDLLKSYGGNAVRIRARKELIEQADKMGLLCMVNLPVRSERDGMDYDDNAAVQQQFDQVIELVEKFKDNPSTMFWSLGNELDWVPPGLPYNQKVWIHLNDLALKIHEIDPGHPVLTTIGSVHEEVMHDFMEKAPAMDLIGLNEYGNILNMKKLIRKVGWNKPYVFTEWGPTGFWQVPKTTWGAPIEETSTEKAAMYQQRYEEAILGDPELCLGSFVFLWRQHQEKTHTWFGMFDREWRETAAVDVMRYEWTGSWPDNRAPVIDSMLLESNKALDNIYLENGNTYEAGIYSHDPDGDSLTFNWELLAEITEYHYGGQGEDRPASIPNFIGGNDSQTIQFRAPNEEGPYRLFVNVYDKNNHVSTANIPFYVK